MMVLHWCRFWLILSFIFIFHLMSGVSFAEKRVALVIGNSAYKHVSVLANPKNDAQAISNSLKKLGFEVITGLDVDRPTFIRKIREFSRALRGAKVATLFYAGHGLQVGGANYLAPVETQLADEEDLEFETIRLKMIIGQMEREPRTNLVFLDACRDNPLARNLARNMGTRSASVGRGLASVDTGVGTLIGFATQPGNVALDGDTKNSPFTASLVKHIETPGVDIAVLLRRVRKDVIELTEGKQVPWSNSSLTGDVILKSKPVKVEKSEPDNSAEVAYWNSIRESKDAEVLKLYISQYPKGVYVGLANYRLGLLADLVKQKQLNAQKSKQPDNALELSYWESVKSASSVGYYQSYLSKYPNGIYAEIAKLKIAELESKKNSARIVLLQQPEEDVRRKAVQSDDVTRETKKDIQRELNRLGCDAGRPDGIWGKGSRRALKQFSRYGKTELASLEPSTTLLEQLKTTKARICPLLCQSGYEKKNNKCVLVKREAGIGKPQQLNNTPTEKKPVKTKINKKTASKNAKKRWKCSHTYVNSVAVYVMTEQERWSKNAQFQWCKEL